MKGSTKRGGLSRKNETERSSWSWEAISSPGSRRVAVERTLAVNFSSGPVIRRKDFSRPPATVFLRASSIKVPSYPWGKEGGTACRDNSGLNLVCEE